MNNSVAHFFAPVYLNPEPNEENASASCASKLDGSDETITPSVRLYSDIHILISERLIGIFALTKGSGKVGFGVFVK